ncbi:hypothetical protein M422DRAFT_62953 [Sphaerobolus stellatus SS14]|nr:hypothetical protein M422DRAFT_62953 [Sphaerobolus stellatus SS14]
MSTADYYPNAYYGQHDQGLYPSSSYSLAQSSSTSSPMKITTSQAYKKSHDRKRDPAHVPRPPNAFMLYRSDFLRRGVIPADVESKQQNISRVVGECWKRLSVSEQKVWRDLAKEKEIEHALKYPEYQYKPTKRGPVQKRRQALSRDQELVHCELLRSVFMPQLSGPPPPRTPEPRRKRKSRAKAYINTPPSDHSMGSSQVTIVTPQRASYDGPIFMEPLIRPETPKLPIHAPAPLPAKQPFQAPFGWYTISPEHSEVESSFKQPRPYDIPAPLSFEEEVQEETSTWTQNTTPSVVPTPPVAAPIFPIANVVEHIRDSYERDVRAGNIAPLVRPFELKAKEAAFELRPFYTAPANVNSSSPQAQPEVNEDNELDYPAQENDDELRYPIMDQQSAESILQEHDQTFRFLPPPAVQNHAYNNFFYTGDVFAGLPDANTYQSPSHTEPQPSFPLNLTVNGEALEKILGHTVLQKTVYGPEAVKRLTAQQIEIDFSQFAFDFDNGALDGLSGNFAPENQSTLFDGEVNQLGLERVDELSKWVGEGFLESDVCEIVSS